jgi:membrane peptidoglycan carboxypeptidase
MAEQKYITQDAADKAKLEPVVPRRTADVRGVGYFVDAVRQQAERAGLHGMNGGYRLYTTLDPALQRSRSPRSSTARTRSRRRRATSISPRRSPRERDGLLAGASRRR